MALCWTACSRKSFVEFLTPKDLRCMLTSFLPARPPHFFYYPQLHRQQLTTLITPSKGSIGDYSSIIKITRIPKNRYNYGFHWVCPIRTRKGIDIREASFSTHFSLLSRSLFSLLSDLSSSLSFKNSPPSPV